MLILFGVFTSSLAEPPRALSKETKKRPLDIDAQIKKIQNAPPAKRVELMNKLKQQLAKMNIQERTNTITHMQERMHGAVEHTEDFHRETDNQLHTIENHFQERIKRKHSETMEHLKYNMQIENSKADIIKNDHQIDHSVDIIKNSHINYHK